MKPSSADDGFVQQPPVLVNQFEDDFSFKRCFRLFLPAHVQAATESEVSALGRRVLDDDVYSCISDAERNEPYVRGGGRDVFGRLSGEVVTAEGWRRLRDLGIAKGIVACGYDTPYGPYSRPLQFLCTHLWSPSSANTACPGAMQDGAASLLRWHLKESSLEARQRRAMEHVFRRLTSRDPAEAWTSGQWMTERAGGVTSRRRRRWLFEPTKMTTVTSSWGLGLLTASSGSPVPLTDSDMAVMLARTSSGRLSAFFAPMRRKKEGGFKGVRISRLKNKFGTRSLPTAELVLDGMRGWLIGSEGQGVRTMGPVLALTRIHSAVAAVGGIGRGLAVARAYARVRDVGGLDEGRLRTRLAEKPLHVRTLARMTAEYHGLMLLTFYAAYVLGLCENPGEETRSGPLAAVTPEPGLTEPLLRVLTQLVKAYVCKASVPLMFACMESLGGIGYLSTDEPGRLDVGRIFRDVCVGPIWEGGGCCEGFLEGRGWVSVRGCGEWVEELERDSGAVFGKGRGWIRGSRL
ncbi:acyl-CoA dehydrogenase [Ophiocordyceps camponoti-floridani]|uniref:Acyl-CoA dehydrogenase n=1 Tax=Ophiocordyceps camponoti-floridani TaxID=2030778 RepID=A0A8H4Q9X8_9HYPO|nr:acyl-CoA dehydrogenase [Ophiocordyceps camponoti-floridani]